MALSQWLVLQRDRAPPGPWTVNRVFLSAVTGDIQDLLGLRAAQSSQSDPLHRDGDGSGETPPVLRWILMVRK